MPYKWPKSIVFIFEIKREKVKTIWSVTAIKFSFKILFKFNVLWKQQRVLRRCKQEEEKASLRLLYLFANFENNAANLCDLKRWVSVFMGTGTFKSFCFKEKFYQVTEFQWKIPSSMVQWYNFAGGILVCSIWNSYYGDNIPNLLWCCPASTHPTSPQFQKRVSNSQKLQRILQTRANGRPWPPTPLGFRV